MSSTPSSYHSAWLDGYCATALNEHRVRNPNVVLDDSGAASVCVVEGFEERSMGFLKLLADARPRIDSLFVARYADDPTGVNKRYRKEFEVLADSVLDSWEVIDNDNDGLWVEEVRKRLNSKRVVIDITGVSNIGMFGVLDAASRLSCEVIVVYTEAAEYWPKRSQWMQLRRQLSDDSLIAEIVDSKPWLFSSEHQVRMVPHHEGYDSPGAGQALLAFLPFKCARLAAVLGHEDYSEVIFVAGQPRLKSNRWRLDALQRINEPIIKDWPVRSLSTFGYKGTVKFLAKELLGPEGLLERRNVHLAIMGSKLQTVGCWAFCSMVSGLTVVTSVPKEYFHEAFSDGIGTTWWFPLLGPHKAMPTPNPLP